MNENTRRLPAFHAAATEFERNRLLHGWLADADERGAFYAELQQAGFPVLRFASLRKGLWAEGSAEQPGHCFLVTGFGAVSAALKHGSVSPYAELDSGGRFMLGIDDPAEHDKQQQRAMKALRLDAGEVTKAAKEAVRLATILPLKNHEFDLVRLARWAAVHYVALLFGMPQEELGVLDRVLWAIYRRLSFQIVGRHFGPEIDGAPAVTAEERERARKELEETIERLGRKAPDPRREGMPARTVIERLGYDADLFHVAMGLMAGTVGNVVAAITDSIHHLIAMPAGRPSFGAARQAAWTNDDGTALAQYIEPALVAHPPAPFLARRVREGLNLSWTDANGDQQSVPQDATLLLALGTDPPCATELRFGGAPNELAYPHRCIGQHLAMPLVIETVRAVLRLPGLDRVYDTDAGRPRPLEKTWGAVCERFPLQFQRDRLMNQQPLHVVLPIKPPVARNARILERLTEAGAPIVEDALRKSGHVHFAWFNIVNGGTHLAMCTVYDGDFDAYVEHFALTVPLFDRQFEFLDVKMPPGPIAEHPKQFAEVIRSHQLKPVAGYFFSAYPHLETSQIAGPAGVQP